MLKSFAKHYIQNYLSMALKYSLHSESSHRNTVNFTELSYPQKSYSVTVIGNKITLGV